MAGWTLPNRPTWPRSVELMQLKYVVLTSVDRDDLRDGGAAHYAACVRAIKARTPGTAVEALTPDFQGVLRDVELVVDSGLDVLRAEYRDRAAPDASGPGSSRQLRADSRRARPCQGPRPSILTKSSLMLGLGETDVEIGECMDDLRAAGVDILTLGQYLRPTIHHLPVERFVPPEEFLRTANGAWRAAFVSAWPARWCDRVTAQSRRWQATTRACETARRRAARERRAASAGRGHAA